jgi:hypothetical protein
MREQFELILRSLETTWYQIAATAPRILAALVLLLLGWVLARWAQRIATKTMRLVRLDVAAEHTGVEDFLVRGGVRYTLVTLIGLVIYWGLLGMFILAVFNVLGLSVTPQLTQGLSEYLPSIVGALVVLVFGSLLARFARTLAAAYLNNVGVRGGDGIAFLLQLAVLTLIAILALQQLRINVALLTSAFQLAFGGLCLAAALAFGLGGRTWAESVLDRTLKRQ